MYEVKMQSLHRDSKLSENDKTEERFEKTQVIIVLDLSGTQDMTIIWAGTVHLDFSFAEPLEESIDINLVKSV